MEVCRVERRRHEVRDAAHLNGLDYLEVADDQRHLTAYFLGKAPDPLQRGNVVIEGGRRVLDIRVVDVRVIRQPDPERDDCVEIAVDRPGDFSTYTLRLVAVDAGGRSTGARMPGIDPRYDRLEFSFKAGCPGELDCRDEPVCPPPERDEPEISYLAKDYASFRRLILDRLALILPEWRERHVPDVGIALVELLAFAGDRLSYYQDAVASEAYLATARRRVSVRRHARLVDYALHEGTNARAWVTFEIDAESEQLDPEAFYLITGYDGAPEPGTPLAEGALPDARPLPYEVFEPLVEDRARPIRLVRARNEIHLYTWGDRQCCLPRGATAATLLDGPGEYAGLGLARGDVLVFEEVKGARTGNPADADPARRHAVRLTAAEPGADPLNGRRIVAVEWADDDALPFPLCISALGPECERIEDVSVARGNVLLVDHGRRAPEWSDTVPAAEEHTECAREGVPVTTWIEPEPFGRMLDEGPLVFAEPLAPAAPACGLLAQDPRRALPRIDLRSTPPPISLAVPAGGASQSDRADVAGAGGGRANVPEEETRWSPRPDLLASGPRDPHFVVEVDNERCAWLRFGDGDLGRMPEAGETFRARYRVGHGPAGNVGAEKIEHLVWRGGLREGARIRARNPLPATGGTAPESLEEAKLLAPHAYRTEPKRAITAADYARLAERHPGVQRAAASLRWLGCATRVLVAIDPRGAGAAGPELLDAVAGRLHRYRRIGHEVVVVPADYVPLEIRLHVCVEPDALQAHVRAAALETLGNRALPDGRRGFFHPDNLSFGEGVHLSRLIAAVQSVEGVESVAARVFKRQFEFARGELERGVLALGPLEIARLDNDPSFPENGLLELELEGGR